MYNLIIVDDDVLVIEGLQKSILWNKLDVDNVYGASDINQAMICIQTHEIKLMVCDIEMPQGNGLQLLEWVRDQSLKIETIILSGHDDFGYAKRALVLGSFDYILKPIPYNELEAAVARAIEKVKMEEKNTQFYRYGSFWYNNQVMLFDVFIYDIIKKNIDNSKESVRQAIIDRNISCSADSQYYPVLISVRNSEIISTENSSWFTDADIINEIYKNIGISECAIGVDKSLYLCLIPTRLSDNSETEEIKKRCDYFIEQCGVKYSSVISCYISSSIYLHQLSAKLDEMVFYKISNVANTNKTFIIKDIPISLPLKLPDMKVWALLLEEGKKADLKGAIQKYFDDLVRKEYINDTFLRQFYQDFSQILYSQLHKKGLHAHLVLGDKLSEKLIDNLDRSVLDLLIWIDHAIDKTFEFINKGPNDIGITEKVKEFIKNHIDEDIKRDEIANYLFLNPDYMARVFKKDTGMPIMEYVTQERMNIAKELLEITDLPVCKIAERVGYTNDSYFTKIFKTYAGVNPKGYRKKILSTKTTR